MFCEFYWAPLSSQVPSCRWAERPRRDGTPASAGQQARKVTDLFVTSRKPQPAGAHPRHSLSAKPARPELIVMPTEVPAHPRSLITDSRGNTTFYDALGRNTGRSSTNSNGTTTIYDASGRNVGSVKTQRKREGR